MTDKHINKVIAEVCGWKPVMCTDKAGNPFPGWDEPPDFCNDLNRMHEAERTSTIFKSWRATKTWMDNLCICSDLKRLPESGPDWAFVLQASAAQRAEAFLKTIGKWEE